MRLESDILNCKFHVIGGRARGRVGVIRGTPRKFVKKIFPRTQPNRKWIRLQPKEEENYQIYTGYTHTFKEISRLRGNFWKFFFASQFLWENNALIRREKIAYENRRRGVVEVWSVSVAGWLTTQVCCVVQTQNSPPAQRPSSASAGAASVK